MLIDLAFINVFSIFKPTKYVSGKKHCKLTCQHPVLLLAVHVHHAITNEVYILELITQTKYAQGLK